MSFYSKVVLPGDGTIGPFIFDKGYLNKSHVKCYLNGVSVGFSFITGSTINLDVTAEIGDTLVIKRETPKLDPIVDFKNGAYLMEQNLDEATLQVLFVTQEAVDELEGSLTSNLSGNFDALNNKLVNLAPGTETGDAVTYEQVVGILDDIQALADQVAQDADDAETSAQNAAQFDFENHTHEELADKAGTLDQFAEGGDDGNIWHTSGRNLKCQGKRAMVGFSTVDGNILAVNYAADFEWLDLFGKHRNNINIERDWPGLQLKPTAPGGTGRIDFIKHDRPDQDYQFRLRTNATSERIVFEHFDANDVYSHIYSLEGDGDIWTKSYGWLHDKFADQNGQQVAKAWASIDGTGTVVANAIYGFSQIQDMGTGKYRCTFSTARPNGNFCAQVSSTDRNGTGKGGAYIRAQTSTYVEVGINRTGIGHMDEDIINIVVFGD